MHTEMHHGDVIVRTSVYDELRHELGPARPRSSGDDDKAIRDAVARALACTAMAEIAELSVGSAGWGTVVLSGAVRSGGDHDLPIATAWSVPDVQAVEDCIEVEG